MRQRRAAEHEERLLRAERAYYGSPRWTRAYQEACLLWGLREPWMLPDMGDVCTLAGIVEDHGEPGVLPPAHAAALDFSPQELRVAARVSFVRHRMPRCVAPPPPSEPTFAELKETLSYWETMHELLRQAFFHP